MVEMARPLDAPNVQRPLDLSPNEPEAETANMLNLPFPIVTRTEARAAGLRFFFVGVVCPNGHVAQRCLKRGECVECRRAQKARHTAKYRDRKQANDRVRYANRKEEQRQYERERREHINQVRKKRDKTKARKTSKNWRDRNRQGVREKARANYGKYRATTRAQQAQYYIANPLPFKRRAHERRLLEGVASGSYTEADVASLFEKQKGKCAICFKRLPRRFHIDHIQPLARGGSNDVANIQLTHPRCNFRKRDKDPVAFAHELGRLL